MAADSCELRVDRRNVRCIVAGRTLPCDCKISDELDDTGRTLMTIYSLFHPSRPSERLLQTCDIVSRDTNRKRPERVHRA